MAAAEILGDAVATLVPYLLVASGQIHGKLGDYAAEVRDCARALSMQEKSTAIDAGSVYAPDALVCLGEGERALGRTNAALAHLERSVAILRREGPADLAVARFALAQALRAIGRDPVRATALAQSARADLANLVGKDSEVAAVDAWLSRGSP
jgi:tetratricopeptide (TPR) repeat protein